MTRFKSCFTVLAAVPLLAPGLTAGAATLSIESKTLRVQFDESSASFSVAQKASSSVFLRGGKLDGVAVGVRTGRTRDKVFGAGQSITVTRADGSAASLELFPDLPFLLVRGTSTTAATPPST
jgi:hypothetical protein